MIKFIYVIVFFTLLSIAIKAQSPLYFIDHLHKISLNNPYYSINNNIGNWHPSVVYFPEGWGKNKKKYWMAWTPNLVGDTKYENPCIAYSDDGEIWDTTGITNPIVDTPGNDYNADTELFYNDLNDSLYCTWKCGDGITYVKQSGDGFKWGSKIFNIDSRVLKGLFFYNGKKNYKVNPTIIFQKELKEYIFYIRLGRDYLENLGLYRWTLDSNYNTIDSTNVEMLNNPKNINCWHFDIFRNPKDKYYYLITDGAVDNKSVFGDSYIWLAKSTDTLGTKFAYYDKPLVHWGSWYKVSAILTNNILKVWIGNIDGNIYYDSVNFDELLSWLNNDTSSVKKTTLKSRVNYKIYPNPAYNNLRIDYNMISKEIINIKLYDCLGNSVLNIENGEEGEGFHSDNIPIASLSSGVYFLTVRTRGIMETSKVIIAK